LICQNISFILDAGAGYDTYLWNTGESTQTLTIDTTNIDSLWLKVTVVYNSQAYTDSIKVTFMGPEIDLGGDSGFCEGESLVLDAGLGNYTYLWSDLSEGQTITVDQTGEYYVTVTDTLGCQGMDTVMITESTGPVVDLGLDAEFCEGDSVILDAGAGEYIFFQ